MNKYGVRTRASSASLVTDCASYYKAIWQAIQKAEKSVFIVGWDIDSRIELLRGEDRPDEDESYSILNVLSRKAEENPQMEFYLNKWKPAVIYAKEREPLSAFKWHTKTPDNVHMLLDDAIASGGSHHQKLIIIDDRIAFSGGMDIALGRWDTHNHYPDDPNRTDPLGPYGPYYDVQLLMEGEAVNELAELARWRWQRAAGYEAIDFSAGSKDVWPECIEKEFSDVPLLISQTFPEMEDIVETREVENILLENIKKAEKFIYIENQYLTYERIAKALNEELRRKPDLRALLVSSYNPKGPIEKEVMWQGRIKFREILEEGIPPGQIKMLYPVSKREDGSEEAVRVHAKLLFVDDKFLHVGSANLNGRSMGHDSECDIVLIAENDDHRKAILERRRKCISKFAGTDVGEEVDFLRLLNPDNDSHLAFHEIDDSQFFDPLLGYLPHKIADRPEPAIPDEIDPAAYRPEDIEPWKKTRYKVAIGVLAILALVGLWHIFHQPATIDFIRARVEWLLDHNGRSLHSLLIVCLAYTVLTLVTFPVTALTAMTSAVFGPLYGFVYAIIASIVSASVAFGIGNFAGFKVLRGLFGARLRKVNNKIARAGVMEITFLRMMPIAPYGVFNLISGVSSVKFLPFIIGTFFGMLPGTIALAILGDSLGEIISEASPKNLAYLSFAILIWIGIIYSMHKAVKLVQKQSRSVTE
jgi:phosphatidylserine/phosphatidylglycerophosphate/cardiolipin synthase-like enzyme/uncharacterized membrane protein YdjX (TVP38/TMEM64 family)